MITKCHWFEKECDCLIIDNYKIYCHCVAAIASWSEKLYNTFELYV